MQNTPLFYIGFHTHTHTKDLAAFLWQDQGCTSLKALKAQAAGDLMSKKKSDFIVNVFVFGLFLQELCQQKSHVPHVTLVK